MSVLGSSRHPKGEKYPGTVNWSDGGSKMIAHIPFYVLAGQGGESLELASHVEGFLFFMLVYFLDLKPSYLWILLFAISSGVC